MKNIKWKQNVSMNTWEGSVDGIDSFTIEGNLCVTDHRDVLNIKHYRSTTVDKSKQIAFDLLNELNKEEHEANYQYWEASLQKASQVMRDTQNLLNSLKQNE